MTITRPFSEGPLCCGARSWPEILGSIAGNAARRARCRAAAGLAAIAEHHGTQEALSIRGRRPSSAWFRLRGGRNLLDRFARTLGNQEVGSARAGLVAIVCFLPRLRLIRAAMVLAAFVPLGGAWHHFRYTDIEPDDLALGVTEPGRPVWVRGVVREARAFARAEAWDSASSDALRVSTRFVLDLTEINDGKSWRKASGRASAIVSGDRSEILPGQPVEAAGQIALLGRRSIRANSLSRVSASRGNSPAFHR